MTTTQTTEATECHACQMDARRAAGGTMTEQERNAWMMWGCTCADNGEAQEWMERVTR